MVSRFLGSQELKSGGEISKNTPDKENQIRLTARPHSIEISESQRRAC